MTGVQTCALPISEVSAKHRIRVDIDALPRSIRIDPKAIDQVITNLIANAMKYSPDAKIIDVRGQVENGRARIDVEDFGLGIDPDDLPKMFTRYFRARTSTGIAGTGIGLSVVKLIVELHNGEVGIDSRKGKGTVFTIFLPLTASARDSEAAPVATAA